MPPIKQNRISKDYINTLPLIKFQGDIILIQTPEDADNAIDYLSEFDKVGFDTETKPSFKKGVSYPVAILQLSTTEKAYLFQLKMTGITDKMINFLENESIEKLGIAVKDDICCLAKLRKFTAGGFVDLGKIAASKGIIQTGVRGLAARYLHHRISKTARRTNWAAPELRNIQKVYAATDAWICLILYPELIADNTVYEYEEAVSAGIDSFPE